MGMIGEPVEIVEVEPSEMEETKPYDAPVTGEPVEAEPELVPAEAA